MKNICVILIDDDKHLRNGITEIIEQQPDIKMIATFGNCKKALTKVCGLRPDVLLLDLYLQSQKTIPFMKSIMKKCPEIKVIVMDIVPINEEIIQYVEAGVAGFILKDATSEDLLKTIRSVANEENVLPSSLTGTLFSQIVENEVNRAEISKLIKKVALTKQEKEIVLLIADGMTNREIAQKLNLSAYLVKSHVHNILEKMILNTQIQISMFTPLNEN